MFLTQYTLSYLSIRNRITNLKEKANTEIWHSTIIFPIFSFQYSFLSDVQRKTNILHIRGELFSKKDVYFGL